MTYPEVSHLSGQYDMVIITFFGLRLLRFFSIFCLSKALLFNLLVALNDDWASQIRSATFIGISSICVL